MKKYSEMVSFPPCGYHLTIFNLLYPLKVWVWTLIWVSDSHRTFTQYYTKWGIYTYISIMAEPYTPYTLSLRSSHEPLPVYLLWLRWLSDRVTAHPERRRCWWWWVSLPQRSMENLEEPLAAREWTWAGAQGATISGMCFCSQDMESFDPKQAYVGSGLCKFRSHPFICPK